MHINKAQGADNARLTLGHSIIYKPWYGLLASCKGYLSVVWAPKVSDDRRNIYVLCKYSWVGSVFLLAYSHLGRSNELENYGYTWATLSTQPCRMQAILERLPLSSLCIVFHAAYQDYCRGYPGLKKFCVETFSSPECGARKRNALFGSAPPHLCRLMTVSFTTITHFDVAFPFRSKCGVNIGSRWLSTPEHQPIHGILVAISYFANVYFWFIAEYGIFVLFLSVARFG